MSDDVEFEGEELPLGRTKYIVPPLSLLAVKKYAAKIKAFAGMEIEEQIDLTIEIAHAAIKRNYPEVTIERIGELIDLNNMGRVFQLVVQTAGFTNQAAGGNAVGTTSQSTGQPSTPT